MKRMLLPLLLIAFCAKAFAQEKLIPRFDSLTQVYAGMNYHGVVLVGNKDRILYQKAFGLADHEKQVPMQVNTIFKTESVGKIFTTTRLMQLVEAGKISLSGTVKEYLPNWKVPNSDKITIHHLLNHTSGLGSPWDHPDFKFKAVYTDAQIKQFSEEVPLAFEEPGTRYHYSNSGYVMLSEIISRASGLSFEEDIRKHIFQPARMKQIDHLHNDTIMPAGAAQPYRMVSSKRFIPMPETVGGTAGGAGGWLTDAESLYRFMSTYAKGKYMKPKTMRQQQTANGTVDPATSTESYLYTYGMEYLPKAMVPAKTIIGHNGGGGGFSADVFLEPESGYIVVVCTNMWGTGRTITANYFNLLFNNPLKPVTHSLNVRLMDLIEAQGTQAMVDNPEEFFRPLGQQPSARTLVNTYEVLDQLRQVKEADQVLQVARNMFPDEAYVWYVSGNSAWKLNRTQEAAQYYARAKELALTKKDTWLVERLEQVHKL